MLQNIFCCVFILYGCWETRGTEESFKATSWWEIWLCLVVFQHQGRRQECHSPNSNQQMFSNETICVVESDHLGQEIQEVGPWYAIGIALMIGIIAAVGLVVRGFFIYYIKLRLLEIDQLTPWFWLTRWVQFKIEKQNLMSNKAIFKYLRGYSTFNDVNHICHDNFTYRNSKTHV